MLDGLENSIVRVTLGCSEILQDRGHRRDATLAIYSCVSMLLINSVVIVRLLSLHV